MSSNKDYKVTDPNKYNKRDLLLFLQLLHTNGLIEPDSVQNPSNSQLLKDISNQWFDHQSTQLSFMNGLTMKSPWTVEQMTSLYNNLLTSNEDCHNTTELANKIYHGRIEELETKLKTSQLEFNAILNE